MLFNEGNVLFALHALVGYHDDFIYLVLLLQIPERIFYHVSCEGVTYFTVFAETL
jgi:hypothetical protein